MSMLTLNEADNKEILYTFIDIDCRYSLILPSLFHVLSFQYCLWSIGGILYSVRDACKMIFLGYDNISAINNGVEC